MAPLDTQTLQRLLAATGAHLATAGETARVLIVGGAALALRGITSRTIDHVDVLALVTDESLTPPDFSPALNEAIRQAARDFDVPEDWCNGEVGLRSQTDLPSSASDDIEWHDFAGLHVGLAGRRTLIAFTFLAIVDHGPDSVHFGDLRQLGPTDQEMGFACHWAFQHVRRHNDPR